MYLVTLRTFRTLSLNILYYLLQLIMTGPDIHQDAVDTEMTEMIASGAVATSVVATLVVAVVVATTAGMILRGEMSSLADHEVAIIWDVTMEKLRQGVIRMVRLVRMEEESLANR